MRRKNGSSTFDGGRRGGGELFICFTARPSATLTRSLSSKVATPHSPVHGAGGAAPQVSSAPHCRRLRRNRSMKGGQSPVIPAVVGGGRKGAAFEAVEPSSPKVTCIGQVRVKGGKRKAKGKKVQTAAALRSRSRRLAAEDVSFRKVADVAAGEKNQGWVCQIPASICDSLKAFGSEINCFLPCGGGGRSFGLSSARQVVDGGFDGKKRQARWLMAVDDGEEDGPSGERDVWEAEAEVEKIIGCGEVIAPLATAAKENRIETDQAEEDARSACVPPPNALLLMRCRSDPVRMAALAAQFWGSPGAPARGRVEEDKEENEKEEDKGKKGNSKDDEADEGKCSAAAASSSENSEEGDEEDDEEEEASVHRKDSVLEVEEEERESALAQEDVSEDYGEDEATPPRISIRQSGGSGELVTLKTITAGRRHSFSVVTEARRPSFSNLKEAKRRASFSGEPARRAAMPVMTSEAKKCQEPQLKSSEESLLVSGEKCGENNGEEGPMLEASATAKKEEVDKHVAEDDNGVGDDEEDDALPDCLLLMMCEPKLSMEVSKETWVCRTDFANWPRTYKGSHSHRRRSVEVISGDAGTLGACKPTELGVDVPATEQKELEQPMMACAPFMLKRCKSAPVRSPAWLAPDACFWKDRHRPVRVAGVGF